MKNYNRLLLVLNYLMKQSDEDHMVTIKDINSFLAEYYLDADRETVADCISELQEAGYDIQCVRSTQNRYYIHNRPFSVAEVKLLVDAVQSSRFITEEQSREIIEKLAALVGAHKGKILTRQLYIGSRAKTDNQNVSEYVEKIHTAITTNKKIIFKYFDYNAEKEKVLKRSGKSYYLSPFTLIWNNDMYYVVGGGDYNNSVLKFRLDRMDGLEISEMDRIEPPAEYNIADFFEKEFSMMGGNPCTVKLLCKNALMGSIVDKFGEDVITEVVDDDRFVVTADVSLSGLFYGWVFASKGAMKIIEPESAVQEFKEIIDVFIS